MKIADGLLLVQDLGQEVARLRDLAKTSGWEYRTQEPNAKWVPNFDLEANRNIVQELSRLQRKLSRSIAKANASTDLDVDDKAYSGWL